jgi:signal transduction histidine kinase
VSDEGIGIPKQAQSRIFEHFFRAENAREHAADGSGLGLYLAKMIMETAGGKIWFKSPIKFRKGPSGMKEGFGSTFYASIPVGGMRGREGERRLV